MTEELKVETIESVLENESEAETKTEVDGPKDLDGIQDKARNKYDMMNIPTERKTAEEIAKLSSQIASAEKQQALSIQQGTAHPEHQTYGVLGIPMAAAVHDFTLNQAAADQASVKTKVAEDSKGIKEHNESLTRIVDAIEKKNEE